jgi:hypothetical protein
MFRKASASDSALETRFRSALQAAHYDRLAGETTGMIRRILLKLRDEAVSDYECSRGRGEVIDLHSVRQSRRFAPEEVERSIWA